ncbi:MAG: metallophosphoesterase [Acidobacteriota bacterium]|nr:metallophosphoesterase [Acidobacteriota bacterium]
MRWVVGDIQGCARELEQLLKEIRFDPARDELWAAGDIVNRGPDSLQALRLWNDLGGRGVLGNHDVYALRAHAGSIPRKPDTLEDVFGSPDCDALLAGLRRLPLLVHLPAENLHNSVWLVHGGIAPMWFDLEAVARRINGEESPDQAHDDAWLSSNDTALATRLRCCDAAGNQVRFTGFPEDCPEGFRPWDQFYRGSTLVVHGHWARRGFYRTARTLGLDDGCVYGGTLTAWCQDEDRIVQVAAAT